MRFSPVQIMFKSLHEYFVIQIIKFNLFMAKKNSVSSVQIKSLGKIRENPRKSVKIFKTLIKATELNSLTESEMIESFT